MATQKINKLSTFHKGNQPVRVLQHNITKQFEETNPTFIQLTKDIINASGLKPGITYHINDLAIGDKVDGRKQTPYVTGEKKIVIHETFLSYVWCVSYSLLVLYDEGVAKPSQNQVAQRLIHDIDIKRIDKALELFKYALTLIKTFSTWDKQNLPNPELFDIEDTFYIEKANGLFVFAMNFILCHEFAHVEKEHFEKRASGQNTDSHILAFEKEADQRAIELMLMGANDTTRATVNFGILTGLCCLLFFRRETTNTTHPDTDDRINSFIEQVNPEPANGMWGIAALAFKLWDNQFTKFYHWPKHINGLKELYYLIRTQIQAEK